MGFKKVLSQIYRSPTGRAAYSIVLSIVVGVLGSRVATALDQRGAMTVWAALRDSQSFWLLVLVGLLGFLYHLGDYLDHRALLRHLDDDHCKALIREKGLDQLAEQVRTAIQHGQPSGAVTVEQAQKIWAGVFKK